MDCAWKNSLEQASGKWLQIAKWGTNEAVCRRCGREPTASTTEAWRRELTKYEEAKPAVAFTLRFWRSFWFSGWVFRALAQKLWQSRTEGVSRRAKHSSGWMRGGLGHSEVRNERSSGTSGLSRQRSCSEEEEGRQKTWQTTRNEYPKGGRRLFLPYRTFFLKTSAGRFGVLFCWLTMTNTAFPGLCAEQTKQRWTFWGVAFWLRGVYWLFRGWNFSSLLCKLSKLFNWYRSVELTYLWPAMYWTCLRLWFFSQ
jgi:hypothetical protein